MDWDWVYDALRVIEMTAGCVAVGAAIATWTRPLSLMRRLRFFVLGAFAGVTAVTGFMRLGEDPVFAWRLFTDAGLTILAAISCVGYYWEAPMEPSPTKVQVDEHGKTTIT